MLKPCAKRLKVNGPGAKKKTQIQMGQWHNDSNSLLRTRILRASAY